eukprot:GHRR01033895.1.p1 GENE.GHRR01033895.1~~GHRR01033895.1.p1  ORF type:complete len:176 (+),score=24.67 GHRR01033895.1:206-733(+)
MCSYQTCTHKGSWYYVCNKCSIATCWNRCTRYSLCFSQTPGMAMASSSCWVHLTMLYNARNIFRFKPAPIYILDEVDAALDLNHTQNIGTMIKQHFPQSQFIVVSLKEGMFNNANVIFRTKFVDGVSTVTRTVNNSGRHQGSSGSRENAQAGAGSKSSQRNTAAGRQALRESNRR